MPNSNLFTQRVWRNYPSFLGREDKESLVYALTEALREAITLGEEGVNFHRLMMRFHTASGEYLDLWGKAFGVPRTPGENDEEYRKRILFEITTHRQTKSGLKSVITFYSRNISPEEIEISEPHTQLHTLSNNFRACISRTPDYRYWSWNIIDIRTTRQISPLGRAKIEEFKAYGVHTWYTITISDYSTDYPRTYRVKGIGINLSHRFYHDYCPLISSEEGKTSTKGIYQFMSLCATKISVTSMSSKLGISGTVYGYGKDSYGTSPYGSPISGISYYQINVNT